MGKRSRPGAAWWELCQAPGAEGHTAGTVPPTLPLSHSLRNPAADRPTACTPHGPKTCSALEVLPKPCPGQSQPGLGLLWVLPWAEPAVVVALAMVVVLALTAVEFSGPQSRPQERQRSSISGVGCPARW